MNILLEQFLIEGRECLEVMGERLLEIERAPNDAGLLDDLFRRMHTLKGNSGLFPDLRDFIHVVHAGEDVLDALREGSLQFSAGLADVMFESLDLISHMLDEVAETETLGDRFHQPAEQVVIALRELLARAAGAQPAQATGTPAERAAGVPAPAWFTSLPTGVLERARAHAVGTAADGATALHAACYEPEPGCYFKGEDPLLLVRQTPGLQGLHTEPISDWGDATEFDPYRSNLRFTLLSNASEAELRDHFRYVEEQVQLYPRAIDLSVSATSGDTVRADTTAAADAGLQPAAQPERTLSLVPALGAQGSGAPGIGGLPEEELAAFQHLLAAQALLLVPGDPATRHGRWRAAARVAEGLARRIAAVEEIAAVSRALEAALLNGHAEALVEVLHQIELRLADTASHDRSATADASCGTPATTHAGDLPPPAPPEAATVLQSDIAVRTDPGARSPAGATASRGEEESASTESGPRVLRVRQEKIDQLMDLVGEMVVAKNALPYLAARAEGIPGARELARELKANYQVINRIAEELQDSIMQVRMLPVSSVFQRFPRLVRDVSRKLNKLVALEITGEETEADKNIIESLADPLIHILRNSLDHGLELPAQREAAGKPAQGVIRIHAWQESDRVMIEISDDGRGIDPDLIRRKAYERGLADEQKLAQMSDHEAVQLVFAAGFSTAEQISELSGRGVGMDVVRRGIERVHGTIALESELGKGTRIRIALPLSMAVTSVMLVRSADQSFGVPMDLVVETVRVPSISIHTIKTQRTAVLRGRIVPLFTLNELLGMPIQQRMNADQELAVLVVRFGGEHVGLVVDDFDETLDIILKPLDGVLSGLIGYAGTALLGDGSVLMVLNVKELL